MIKKWILFFLLLSPGLLSAQTFNQVSPYDVITYNGDTLNFSFTGIPAGAWGNAVLRLYFEGDDGDFVEWLDAYDENLNYLGRIGPNPQGDCAPEDSVDIVFAALPSIPNWAANGSIEFILVPTFDVDQFCIVNQAKVRLIFNYCQFGQPVQLAQASAADSLVCAIDGAVALSGIPAGGTFSGPGVSGNTFDPAGLPIGSYTLTYSATDSIGCFSTDEVEVVINTSPSVAPGLFACPGDPFTITPAGGVEFIFFSDAGMTMPLDTGATFTTPPLFAPATYYVATRDVDENYSYSLFSDQNFTTVDHDALGGDDRGGICLTPDFVFVNCDASAVRYDHNLTPGSGLSLPVRDGMFSDLRSGRIYTLWDGSSDPQFAPFTFTATSVREMDTLLNITASELPFTEPVELGQNLGYTGIFSGYGYLGLYSGETNHYYVVDLDAGFVNDLGAGTLPAFGNENWAIWGLLEGDCAGNFSVIFRDNLSSNLIRYELPSGPATIVASFSDLSDCGTVGYSPTDNRWYFHYENSGQFGGFSETLGYADGGAIGPVACGGGGLSCPIEVDIDVTQLSIGNDTTICDGGTATFSSGLGYSSISWNGNNTNQTVFSTTSTGPVIFEGVDLNGCTLRDTVIVSSVPGPDASFTYVPIGLSVDFVDATSAGLAPYTYHWEFGDGTNANTGNATHTYPAPGNYHVCLTVTDARGCEDEYCDAILVGGAGIEDAIGGRVSLYPNPAQDRVTVDLSLSRSEDVTIKVLGLQGQVLRTELRPAFSSGQVELNLSDLAAGIYLVQVSTPRGAVMRRLVLE